MVIFRERTEADPPPTLPSNWDSHSHFSPCPGGMAAGADLLEEHLGEIRNLRQRLEESICINDRLREQLEHRLSSTTRDSGRGGPALPVSGYT